MTVGEIYHCHSSSSSTGFTQLARFVSLNYDGSVNITIPNIDITNPEKPIKRKDGRISSQSKWVFREATEEEKILFKIQSGEPVDQVINHYEI